MRQSSKNESPLKKKFARLGICSKEIKPGEIWIVKDETVVFPETRLPGFPRTEHEHRPVIILSCEEDCRDPQTITVIICPLTTRTDIFHQSDYLHISGGGQCKGRIVGPPWIHAANFENRADRKEGATYQGTV